MSSDTVKKILIVVGIVAMMSGLGCAALSKYITPAEINERAINYVVNNGDGATADYAGYPSMFKAEKLKNDVDSSHSKTQLELMQEIEFDNLEYSINADVVSTNLVMAQQREEALFGEQGLLSMGLTVAGFGGLTGMLGLMRKRPGDIAQADVERVVTDVTGQTMVELEAKNKQLFQVVKGVQVFMDSYKNKDADVIIALKDSLDRMQDADTKVAVATLKVPV